ncbi:MAG TPA: D-2-hydroxyacid dehydrogenase [Saprospiraceae bacterium]|nr:D-2-hydroxyacid dehydrogenase [Saprospiraceae bacterium]
MARILVNDGIEESGKVMLEAAGFEVDMNNIPQDQLIEKLNAYDAICVRSATKVRKDLIDACPNLKVIARGGVGLDNIDVEYAKSKGIKVINTPAASSRSVAELVFGHLLGIVRFLNKSNQAMPSKGATEFNALKKAYAKGIEIEGKTLGVIGMGRIGQETMKMGLGLGMEVVAFDPFVESVDLTIGNSQYKATITIQKSSIDDVLAKADFLSMHVPGLAQPIMNEAEFAKMKDGAILINCSRGGVVNEDAMLAALNSGKLAAAGIDVFDNEPTPREDILTHPKVSLTPHIGASTAEAQEKVGAELANQLISILG